MTDVAMEADQGTGRGLMEFLDSAIAKGWFNLSSGKAMKTACQKVFEVESGWEDLDLRALDVDALLERWANLRRNQYSDGSLNTYKTRFRQAVRMYTARLDGDSAWRTYGPTARAERSNGGSKKTPVTPTPSDSSSSLVEAPDLVPVMPQHLARPSLMDFPYPLRDDLDVFLRLPRDLTALEAERLSKYIRSLARDEPPEG